MCENVTARTPVFCVVLKDGEHWQVEAEWPDGTIEQVEKFKAGFEALNWVKTQSAAWVAHSVGMARRQLDITPQISDVAVEFPPEVNNPQYPQTK